MMIDHRTIVRGQSAPLLHVNGFRIPLLPHQAFAADWVDSKFKTLVIHAPTGGGKTLAALATAVRIAEKKEHVTAVFIYPTNELIQNQLVSIRKSMIQLGYRPRIFGLEYPLEQGDYDVSLIEGTGEFLHSLAFFDKLGRFRERRQSFGKVLADVLGHEARMKILATTPDSLYLLVSAHYSSAASLLTEAAHADLITIDEFHAYWGVSLANLLYCLKIIDKLGKEKRFMFLSATPSLELLELLRKIFDPLATIDLAEVVDEEERQDRGITYNQVGMRSISHDVSLRFHSLSSLRDLESTYRLVKDVLTQRSQDPHHEAVPCVVILNSPLDAVRLADFLSMKGLNVKQSHGLIPKEMRSIGGEVVVGTSAIELGIDFEAEWLLFEGRESSSFLQRFGRVGRHFKGNAAAFVPDRILKLQIPKEFADRNEFTNFINQSLLRSETYCQFVCSSTAVELLSAIVIGICNQLKSIREEVIAKESEELILELARSIQDSFGQGTINLRAVMQRSIPRLLAEKPSLRGGALSMMVFVDRFRSVLTLDAVDVFEKLEELQALTSEEIERLLESTHLSNEAIAMLLYAINTNFHTLRAKDITKNRAKVEVAVKEQNTGVSIATKRNPLSIFVDGQPVKESQRIFEGTLFHTTNKYYDWRLNPVSAYESRGKYVVLGSNALLSKWAGEYSSKSTMRN